MPLQTIANAQLDLIGQVLIALLAWKAEFLITQPKCVFALNLQDGMDLHVLKYKSVLMEKNGTCLNLDVFVLLEHSGMELIVHERISVQEVKFWTIKMYVSAQMVPTSETVGAKALAAQAVNNGTEDNVLVQTGIISMELYAYFVSMDKSGTQQQELVNVQSIILGMETYVKSNDFAQVEESTSKNMINVYALKELIGMVLNVLKELHVVAVKFGMKPHLNAIVLQDLIMMDKNVFFV